MIAKPDAEAWLRRVNTIISAFRGTADVILTLEQALAQLRSLGISEGDALRWLKPKGQK